MRFEETDTGNLRILVEDAQDREWLMEQLMRPEGHNDQLFLADLLEHTGWQPNGRLFDVRPESIAALTEAPILSDDVTYLDDGTQKVAGQVWWYPDYMVSHFGEQLARNGSVLFQRAPSA